MGPAHLARFGTLQGVLEEKCALIRNVPVTGLVLLGSENSLATEICRCTRAPVILVPGRGRALSENIARQVARFFALDEGPTEQAIAAFIAHPGRLRVVKHGEITLIDDSFNANPLSMKLGLDSLASIVRPGDCVLVKGSHAAHMDHVVAGLTRLGRIETPT